MSDWGEDSGSEEGYREDESGYRENKQGSEEHSVKRRRYWPVMGGSDGRLYFIPLRLWFRVIDLRKPSGK